MLWITITLCMLPLYIWLWWGMTFTTINYVVQWAREKGFEMQIEQERARIVRYTTIDNEDMPGLLSYLDETRNILNIDGREADRLPDFIRNHLEMTDLVFTKVSNSGATIKFIEY